MDRKFGREVLIQARSFSIGLLSYFTVIFSIEDVVVKDNLCNVVQGGLFEIGCTECKSFLTEIVIT